MSSPGSLEPVPGRIVLAGIGREGSSFVHALDVQTPAVRKLFITAAPTSAILGSPNLLTIRDDGGGRDAVQSALAGAQMLIALAAVTGREEKFTPEIIALARKTGTLAVAVLVEPILSHSPHKSESSTDLAREVIRSADATILFIADQKQAGAALTLTEALDDWTRRLSAAIQGLLSAAATENAMDMDFSDIVTVLSGHTRATVGSGKGKTVEDALRDAARQSLTAPSDLESARSVFAHVVVDGSIPLDDARRVLPILEHLFPKAETGCGVSVDSALGEVHATIIAGKLEAAVLSSEDRRRTLQAESPFFKVGDPTVYDGENLDTPAFIRRDVALPGGPPRPVPEQKTLFDGPPPENT